MNLSVILIFVSTKFLLLDDRLELRNLLGMLRATIPLTDIKRIKFIQEEYLGSYVASPLYLFLWNKKFKRYKRLDLYGKDKLLTHIDGHYIEDRDFEILRKRLKTAR